MSAIESEFIQGYLEALRSGSAAVFAGAGLSRPAGYVDWKGLLKSVASELGLEIEHEHDLIALAQYHFNLRRNRGALNKTIVDEFSRSTEVTDSHRLLARLPIRTYWTTNYDDLIERALREAGKTPDVKVTTKQLSHTIPYRDAVIYKMHGDYTSPDDTILIKNDYESYPRTHELFTTTLRGDLIDKTFLFLGFSFTDPNLNHVLSRIRVLFETATPNNYCVMKRETPQTYEAKKQDHQIEDLKRYGINTILLDDYHEIPELLKRVSNLYLRGTVLISGSAHEYGSWGAERASQFVHRLGNEFAKNHIRVVSGFGTGIGSFIINGVLDHMYSTTQRNLDDYLILRPFPQVASGTHSIAELWQRHRREMISQAGIAVFLFGNKLIDGAVVPANGVESEFELAKQAGLKLIPVGATGYVAERLHKLVLNEFESYFDDPTLRNPFMVLGDTAATDDTLANALIEIVERLNRY